MAPPMPVTATTRTGNHSKQGAVCEKWGVAVLGGAPAGVVEPVCARGRNGLYP
jgi:hypothetical protein